MRPNYGHYNPPRFIQGLLDWFFPTDDDCVQDEVTVDPFAGSCFEDLSPGLSREEFDEIRTADWETPKLLPPGL